MMAEQRLNWLRRNLMIAEDNARHFRELIEEHQRRTGSGQQRANEKQMEAERELIYRALLEFPGGKTAPGMFEFITTERDFKKGSSTVRNRLDQLVEEGKAVKNEDVSPHLYIGVPDNESDA